MVETIAPVVHGARRSRWWLSVALHAVGTTLAAAAFGAGLGGLGALVGAPWGRAGLVAVAAVAAIYALRELLRVPVPLPDRRRQVPEWWRTFFPPSAASFLYGLGLGVGFLTYLRHGTLVAVAVAAVASGDPVLGSVLVAPFGLARGVSVLASRRGTTGTAIASTLDRLEGMAEGRFPAVANGLVLVVLGAAAAIGAGRIEMGTPTSGLGAWVLAAVFGWAAVAKVLRREVWVEALRAYDLGQFERAAVMLVPTLEAGIVVLVAGGFPRVAGLASLLLLAAFSAAVLRARARVGDRLPCGCFGRTARRDVRLVLFRNAALAALGALVAATPGGAMTFRWATETELLPTVLVAGAVVLAGAMLWELARMADRPAPR
jgi:hypothetical protein